MSAYGVACQEALFAALSAANLAGGRIYDDAPQGVAFPWIEIGDVQLIPDDAVADGGTDGGVSEFIDLHVWSRFKGKSEAQAIIDSLHTLLHGASLTVDGRASALAWVRNARILRDPDGVTRHGVVSVEIVHRS